MNNVLKQAVEREEVTENISVVSMFGSDYPSPVKRAEALIALARLIEYRDSWNRTDGFTRESKQHLFSWSIDVNRYTIMLSCHPEPRENRSLLYFGNQITRDKFYETFRDTIESLRVLF